MKLRIKSLSKRYSNSVLALAGVDLEIKTGMFGLLGPNGAGKSTLMRILATVQQPDRGQVYFNDINLLEAPFEIRKILGYLPQDFGVYTGISAERLLQYFAHLKGLIEPHLQQQKVREVLELTNLWDKRQERVSEYSGGMKQRFGIAQVLLNDPELIIVDEPTAGLDPAERQHFLNILREIGTEKIVIFSTHIVEDIHALCNDLGILHQGQLKAQISPREAIHSIKGKIWQLRIERHQLEEYRSRPEFLSSSFTPENEILVRLFAEQAPDTSASQARESLEDFYFYLLKQENSNV